MMKAYTSIGNKETRARIENLQPSELLVGKSGTHNVKIYTDYFTKHRQNGGHQRKTRNVRANLRKADVFWCRGHQRKNTERRCNYMQGACVVVKRASA